MSFYDYPGYLFTYFFIFRNDTLFNTALILVIYIHTCFYIYFRISVFFLLSKNCCIMYFNSNLLWSATNNCGCGATWNKMLLLWKNLRYIPLNYSTWCLLSYLEYKCQWRSNLSGIQLLMPCLALGYHTSVLISTDRWKRLHKCLHYPCQNHQNEAALSRLCGQLEEKHSML